ncbi:MAG: hypothetical protein AAFO91_18975 [Bacteroidota bacterium]
MPAQIKKQSKEKLLIKVRSHNQGTLLRQVTELAGFQVVIEEHLSMNQCKGTIYSESLAHSSISELQEALKDQSVIKVERLKARIQGELKETHRYLITFNKPDLPSTIQITDWHHELDNLHIALA